MRHSRTLLRADRFGAPGGCMNITVFLGSGMGNEPRFSEAARELGWWIAQRGHTLVYGGSASGLMGVLARSALEAGGSVIGVEPQMFVDENRELQGLTRLIVTEDMAQRKAEMIRLGDAFIAFPGGTGTLEEIGEVMSRLSMKQLQAPCILYDLDGYYAGLRQLLDRMLEKGLSDPDRLANVRFAKDLNEIAGILNGI